MSNRSLHIGIVIFAWLLNLGIAQAHENKQIEGHIRNISPEYGNLNTSFTQADLDALELKLTGRFLIKVDQQPVLITLGEQYQDVDKGQWVGFIDWEGFLRIAIHYGNAAEKLAVKPLSSLQLSRPTH
jgi:S-adenosylmethionine hydrolase